MGEMSERLQEVNRLLVQLRKRYPAETEAFLNFMMKAEAGPALSKREKELINVALAVAAQCEWCIAFHVRNALQAGATQDEIVEAGWQAVLMHGGPALMHLVPLMQALDEFSKETMA